MCKVIFWFCVWFFVFSVLSICRIVEVIIINVYIEKLVDIRILISIFNNICIYCIVINFIFNVKEKFNLKSFYFDVGLF